MGSKPFKPIKPYYKMLIKKNIYKLIIFIFDLLFFPFFTLITYLSNKKNEYYIWGTTPLINNRYWADAVARTKRKTLTIASQNYIIHNENDFDLYFSTLTPKWLQKKDLIFQIFYPYFILWFVLRNAKVLHMDFHGFLLGNRLIWRIEAYLYKIFNIKTVVAPYGADAYPYSQIHDASIRIGLLAAYPHLAKQEQSIIKKINYWSYHADLIIGGIMLDGMSRMDITVPNYVQINTEEWEGKKSYSKHNGLNGVVKVLHAPNHRGVKGTEFIIKAIEELKAEGLNVELILLEQKKNTEVKEMMQEIDILADQIVLSGYGLNAIEGLASGLPVLSNLESEYYMRHNRRYSFLNECPILSTNHESLKLHLRTLIMQPELREQLGRASRQYAEKYHSHNTSIYMFEKIYDKIIDNKQENLIFLFHPLLSEYNNKLPYIIHPLNENHLP